MTNSEKLRALADWFDQYDSMHTYSPKEGGKQVQIDLRAMASEFDEFHKPIVSELLLDFFRKHCKEYHETWTDYDITETVNGYLKKIKQ